MDDFLPRRFLTNCSRRIFLSVFMFGLCKSVFNMIMANANINVVSILDLAFVWQYRWLKICKSKIDRGNREEKLLEQKEWKWSRNSIFNLERKLTFINCSIFCASPWNEKPRQWLIYEGSSWRHFPTGRRNDDWNFLKATSIGIFRKSYSLTNALTKEKQVFI